MSLESIWKKATQDAEADLAWYFGQCDGEACGLRSVGWNVLEETDGAAHGGPGGARVRHFIDPYPDNRDGARERLVSVHRAFLQIAHNDQAVLEARFTPRSPRAAAVRGLGELAFVALLLPCVQRRIPSAGAGTLQAVKTALKADPEAFARLTAAKETA